jgi:hypothetical protein
MAARGVEQQVFAAPPHAGDAGAAESDFQVIRHRPAQRALAHGDAAHFLALDVRFDTAAGGFHFGQFRHRISGARCEGESKKTRDFTTTRQPRRRTRSTPRGAPR